MLPVAVALIALAGCGGGDERDAGAERPNPPPAETAPRTERAPAGGPRRGEPVRAGGEARLQTVATGLVAPWEIAFLPDRDALVTERPGRVRLLGRDGRLRREPVAEIEVTAIGESGLLGMAVDPEFERNRFVYLYRTTSDDNEVLRYRFQGGRLTDEATILEGLEAGVIHDGGRINF